MGSRLELRIEFPKHLIDLGIIFIVFIVMFELAYGQRFATGFVGNAEMPQFFFKFCTEIDQQKNRQHTIGHIKWRTSAQANGEQPFAGYHDHHDP